MKRIEIYTQKATNNTTPDLIQPVPNPTFVRYETSERIGDCDTVTT